MKLRFKKEIDSWKKLGFLNPYDLKEEDISKFPVMYGVRVVIVTEEGKVILINIKNKNVHTLVGGHIEEKESIEDCLARESLEESGYKVSQVNLLGYIELWKKDKRKFDFGFIAKAVGEQRPLQLTKTEIAEGQELEYLSLEESIETTNNDVDKTDSLLSIRSLMFLEEAKKHIRYYL